jgi:hypothetical protein
MVLMFFLILLVLRMFFIKFEDTKQIQNLNLIFLYFNLVLFVLFFFDDLESIFFLLKKILLDTYYLFFICFISSFIFLGCFFLNCLKALIYFEFLW